MADVSRQRERGCVARGGREGEGGGEERVRWSLCTCINSKLRYGSFVLVNRANLPACVTGIMDLCRPLRVISLQPLVVLLALLAPIPPPPLFLPLPIFSFTDFGAVRGILICVCSARTGGTLGIRVFRETYGEFYRKSIHLLKDLYPLS